MLGIFFIVKKAGTARSARKAMNAFKGIVLSVAKTATWKNR